MPTVLRTGRYRFHSYSDERGEPPHIHVAAGDGECKFWLEPIMLAHNRGLRPDVVRRTEQLVYEHGSLLKEKYYARHKS